jgi:hypothetical protein
MAAEGPSSPGSTQAGPRQDAAAGGGGDTGADGHLELGLRRALHAAFAPFNEALYELLGRCVCVRVRVRVRVRVCLCVALAFSSSERRRRTRTLMRPCVCAWETTHIPLPHLSGGSIGKWSDFQQCSISTLSDFQH